MYYLLEKNDKGFYEIDGEVVIVDASIEGVKVTTFDAAPIELTFKIGEDTYFISGGLCEDNRVQEVSRLTLDEDGEVVSRQHLEGLEIRQDHPVLQFLDAGDGQIKPKPLEAE